MARFADQVPDDQKVGFKAHLPDHTQLVPDPLGDLGGNLASVAFPRSLPHQFLQIGGVGVAGRRREVRQEEFTGLHAHLGPLGHQKGVVTGARIQVRRKAFPHVAGRLDVKLLGVETQPVVVGEVGAGVDAQQHIVGLRLIRPGVVGVVGGQKRRSHPPREFGEFGQEKALMLEAVVHDLDEEVLPAEDVLVLACRPGGGVGVEDAA